MPGFWNKFEQIASVEEFEELITSEGRGYRLSTTHMNARHFIHGQPESALPGAVQNLLLFLLDAVMPLGIPNFDQLNDANKVLQMIEYHLRMGNGSDIQNISNSDIQNLSNSFYSMVPHSGVSDRRQLIDNEKWLKMKKLMVAHLRSVLESLYAGLACNNLNPIDYFCSYWLKTELRPIDRSSDEFTMINTFINNTQHADDAARWQISEIFEVESQASNNFNSNLENHRYLIHSTYPDNILGILRNGLVANPGHVHSFNRYLGDGIYFWDAAGIALEKFKHETIQTAILPLCRVAFGKGIIFGPNESFNQNDYLHLRAEGKMDSVISKAAVYPEFFEAIEWNGASIPTGTFLSRNGSSQQHQYNRYMVFDAQQVKVEYILRLEKISDEKDDSEKSINMD